MFLGDEEDNDDAVANDTIWLGLGSGAVLLLVMWAAK